MKLKATVEVALPERERGGNLDDAKRDLQASLPRTAVVKEASYVAEPEDLKAALKELLKFRLEGIPEYFTELPGYAKGDEEAPFFSEGFLYPLLGKENARSVLSCIHDLIKLAGLDPYELDREVDAEKAAEEAAEKARQERIATLRRERQSKK